MSETKSEITISANNSTITIPFEPKTMKVEIDGKTVVLMKEDFINLLRKDFINYRDPRSKEPLLH